MGRISALFKADGAETAGRYSISEWWLEPHHAGPVAHSHAGGRRLLRHRRHDELSARRRMDARGRGFVRPRAGRRDPRLREPRKRASRRAEVSRFPAGSKKTCRGIAQWFAENPPGKGRQLPDGPHTALSRPTAAETKGRYSTSEWPLEPYTKGPEHIARRRRVSFVRRHDELSLKATNSSTRPRARPAHGRVTHAFKPRKRVSRRCHPPSRAGRNLRASLSRSPRIPVSPLSAPLRSAVKRVDMPGKPMALRRAASGQLAMSLRPRTLQPPPPQWTRDTHFQPLHA